MSKVLFGVYAGTVVGATLAGHWWALPPLLATPVAIAFFDAGKELLAASRSNPAGPEPAAPPTKPVTARPAATYSL